MTLSSGPVRVWAMPNPNFPTSNTPSSLLPIILILTLYIVKVAPFFYILFLAPDEESRVGK